MIFDGGEEANIVGDGSSSDESLDSRGGWDDNDKDKDLDKRILSSMEDIWDSFEVDDNVPRRTY